MFILVFEEWLAFTFIAFFLSDTGTHYHAACWHSLCAGKYQKRAKRIIFAVFKAYLFGRYIDAKRMRQLAENRRPYSYHRKQNIRKNIYGSRFQKA